MSLQSLIDKPKELLELIDSCLKPKQEEKKKFGEVFTPMKLVNEMLDKLDEYYIKENNKSIFEEPNYKWFDPANGMGNFPIAIYLKLMNGLNKIIINEKDRKKHILENMLYMSELNKKNVFICKQIFNINNEYKLNFHEGDTLKLDPSKEWGIKEFDIVIGNPPYNKGGIRSHTGKQLGEKNETIWPDFIKFALKHIKTDGFLIYINPLSWLKKTHSMHKIILENHVIWLKLWDNSKAKHEINADIPLSFYIMRKIINQYNKSIIISQFKRINLNTESKIFLNYIYSIPLAYPNIFNKLIRKISENSLQLDVNNFTVKGDKKQVKLPNEYTLKDMYGIDTYRVKDGYFIKKMLSEHKDQKEKKLIIANKASLKGSLIDDGRLGLVGNHKFYILGEKLDLLKKFFETKLCEIISQFTKYGQDFLDNEAFTFIPDVRKILKEKFVIDEIYKYFEFTIEEIKIINNFKKK